MRKGSKSEETAEEDRKESLEEDTHLFSVAYI